MAGLPTDGPFVWLPEQRKAARWGDPAFNAYSYEAGLARTHNGHFVALTCKHTVREHVRNLETFISERAGGAEDLPNCYWLDGDWSGDEGPNYCWECACKAVDAAFAKDPQTFANAYGDCHGDWKTSQDYYDRAIDGGWSMDHDSPPNCEECGDPLEGTLTAYGSEEELRALLTKQGIAFDDVESWYWLAIAVQNLPNDHPWWNKIAKAVDAVITTLPKAGHESP